MKNNKHISINEIWKELPFSVPENYFNDFALQLEQQIGIHKQPASRFIKPWMYMAAMFVGIFVLGQVFYTLYSTSSQVNQENYETYVLSQVDESSILDYYVDESVK